MLPGATPPAERGCPVWPAYLFLRARPRAEAGRAPGALALSTAWQAAEAPQKQQPQQQQQRREGDELPVHLQPAPPALKVQRDLELYWARRARQASMRARTLGARVELERRSEAGLRRCLALDPTDGRAYVGLGKLLAHQRRHEEARALYQEGSQVTEGQNEFVWQAWATLEARLGNVAEARKLYDAATVANSAHAAAWHGWGQLEKKAGDLLRARKLWLKGVQACRADPNPYLYQSLALLMVEQGFPAEARAWFAEGTATLPGAASQALWHAWAEMEAHDPAADPDSVRRLFQRGLGANARSRYVYLSYARWELAQGNVEEARRLFAEGVKRNPRDSALLQAWAGLEAEGGSVEVARGLLGRASLVDPTHVPTWQRWAVMEAGVGNVDRARELFQQAVWAAPHSTSVCHVWQAWGVLEDRAGNADLAQRMFACAVKADPRSTVALQTWEAFERRQGDTERADELREHAQRAGQPLALPSSFPLGPGDPEAAAPVEEALHTVSRWWTQRVVPALSSGGPGPQARQKPGPKPPAPAFFRGIPAEPPQLPPRGPSRAINRPGLTV